MAKRPVPDATTAVTPVPDSSAPAWELPVMAGLGALFCLGIAFFGRYTMNPDGVSYLDLASALRDSDWYHFIQGYWSPLLPALLAELQTMVGGRQRTIVVAFHFANALLMLGAIALVWAWMRRVSSPWLPRAAFATLFLASSGMPRIEAITPDVLLLAIMVWLAYELLARSGERWFLTGLLLGLAYLTKTSAWPWLIVAVGIRLWGAWPDLAARRNVWRSTIVNALVMLCWIVPMSMKARHPTMGTSASLNACWYLEDCDSRSPDTHKGRHDAYRMVSVGDSVRLTVATFIDGDRWTYEPWSDPTQWHAGVRSESSQPWSLGVQLTYSAKILWHVLSLWLSPLLLAVMLPIYLLGRRRGMWRELRNENRDAAVVILLGAVGVLQFVAVHAESRLLAPFSFLLGMGWVSWCCSGMGPGAAVSRLSRPVRQFATLVGLATALGFAIDRELGGIDVLQRTSAVTAALDETRVALSKQGYGEDRVVLFGEAMPATASAWWVGARIVAQVPPASTEAFMKLPGGTQQALLQSLFRGKADVAWLIDKSGQTKIALVTPR